MVLPIGGFMPIPLAMMIPFMATQSMVMGHAFGSSFQYGKRKISAMGNEEFNKFTLNDLAEDMYKSYSLIIPKLEASIDNSTELQNFIVRELIQLPVELLKSLFGGGDSSIPPTPVKPPEPVPRQPPPRARQPEDQIATLKGYRNSLKSTIQNLKTIQTAPRKLAWHANTIEVYKRQIKTFIKLIHELSVKIHNETGKWY